MSSVTPRQSRLDFIQIAFRNWKLIGLVGVGTFLLTAPLVYWLTRPEYQAVVELRVDPTSGTTTGYDSGSLGQFYSEYVATQKFKILKRSNVEAALNSLSPDDRLAITKGKAVDDRFLEALIKRIEIDPTRDNLILPVAMSSGEPEGIAPFLNALVAGYLADLESDRTTFENSRLRLSDRQQQTLSDQIQSLTDELHKISEETGSINFDTDDLPFRIELRTQEQAAISAENDRQIKEQKYNQFLSTLDSAKALGTDAAVEDRIRNDAIVTEQKRLLVGRISGLSDQLSTLAPGNPRRKDLDDSIAGLQGQLQEIDNAARKKYRDLLTRETSSTLEKQRLDLYNDYMVAKGYEDSIKASYAAIQEKYSYYSKRILRAKSIQEDLTNLKAQLARQTSSATDILAEQSSRSLVTLENAAKTPLLPTKSNRVKNLAIDLILSFGWISFVVLGREIWDQRVKSVPELKSFTGLQPSWPISHYSGDFLRLSLIDPTAPSNKAIASLATRINHHLRSSQAKVVTFSGIAVQSGTTEILLNCAHNMRTNCGKILVVDFNVRRPGIANKLSIANDRRPSMADVEKSDWEDLVYRDESREIDVLAIQSPRTMDNRTVDRIIEQARDRYDVIFVDASPIIGSPQTEHVFMNSDLVVFTVLGNHTLYPEIRHSLDLAVKVDVSSVALILNWWKPHRGEPDVVGELLPETDQ